MGRDALAGRIATRSRPVGYRDVSTAPPRQAPAGQISG